MAATTHKCGISGCKAQTSKRSAICAWHRDMLPAALLAEADRLYAARLAGDSAALTPYFDTLAAATRAARMQEQGRLL